jgi:thioredoxin-related protein
MKVETVANWMVIVTSVAVTTLVGSKVIADYRRPLPTLPQTYQVGEKLAVADAPVDFSKAPQTLVLVLSSQCHFCTESMPFYRDLLKARAGQPQTRMVAVGLEDAATLREYVKQHDLQFDDVATVPRDKIKFRGTPTLVLFDRSGTVKGVWGGFLTNEKRRDELLKLVTAGHA